MKIWKNYIFNLLVLSLVSCLLVWLTDKFILTNEFFIRNGQSLSGKPEQEAQTYQLIQKYIYLSAVAYLMLRVFTVSLILYTALYLSEVAVPYKKILSGVTLAEFIFLVPAIIKITHFYLIGSGFTLSEWQAYYAFSVLSLLENVPADWQYAAQTINLFECIYWFLLATVVHKTANINFDTSLRIVVRSYLPALLIWICLLTFLTIIYFPANS